LQFTFFNFSGQDNENNEPSRISTKTDENFDNSEIADNSSNHETNLLLQEIENFTKAFEAEEIKNKIKFEQQLTAGKKIAMFCVCTKCIKYFLQNNNNNLN
jgi:hypothetical protein